MKIIAWSAAVIYLCASSLTAQIDCQFACTTPDQKRIELLRDLQKQMRPGFTFEIGDTGVLGRDDLTGAKPPPPEQLKREAAEQHKNVVQEPSPGPGDTPLPPMYDWAAEGKVTAIKCQWCGDCWAFASAAVMESSLVIGGAAQDINLSEQSILDCSGGGDCTGGWWGPVFRYFHTSGEPDEAHYSYQHSQGSCRAVDGEKPIVTTWDYVAQDGGDSSVEALKQAIKMHGPVVTTIYSTRLFQAYRRGVFNELPNYQGSINHAVVIVGWDESKHAWKIKNSWGKDCWGEGGYGWVSYGANHIGWGSAWVQMKK
jgi:C1A family cysteine protease